MLTFSTSSLSPPGTSFSDRTSSNVSPSSGLNGLRIDRSFARKAENCDTAKAVTYRRRSPGVFCFAARSRRSAYSSCSASRWSSEHGSFADTGIEMVERSLPTFLRTKAMRLGGESHRRRYCCAPCDRRRYRQRRQGLGFRREQVPVACSVGAPSGEVLVVLGRRDDESSWMDPSSTSEARRVLFALVVDPQQLRPVAAAPLGGIEEFLC